MSLRRILCWFYLGIALIGLAGGYGLIAQWVGAGLVLATSIAILFSNRLAAAWSPSACLVILVGLAVVGLFQGAPAFAMLPGTAAALAVWDLMNLDRTMGVSSSSGTAGRFETRHIQMLSLAIGLGVVMAFSGKLVPLPIPFVLLVLVILLDMFGLDRLSHRLAGRPGRP